MERDPGRAEAEVDMYRMIWLAVFCAISAAYFFDRMWVLGLVLHTILLFAWLVVSPGESRKKE